MKGSDQDYVRQVMVLIAIIVGIWAIGIVVVGAFADHAMFDYDVGIDMFTGENDNGFITLTGTVTNYGNEHIEFTYTIYINDKFIAEKDYLLGVGQYVTIEYIYNAKHLGYAVQNFDATVWSELDQYYDNDWETAYVTTGIEV